MSKSGLVTQSRELRDFDRVVLRDYGDLAITQGEKESLTIEAERELLKRIRTEVRGGRLDIRIGASWLDKVGHALSSLAGKTLKYTLCVKRLTRLSILGAARVSGSGIQADRLELELGGAGKIKIKSLAVEQLEVDLRGAGRIELTGQVKEQTVTLGGAGTYRARRLESKRATIDLRGAGQATVWAVEELDAAIHGLGTVEYYGSPRVRKNVSGLGKIGRVGSA